nr:hypothetical protein [Tanacetum cinerariifolium]
MSIACDVIACGRLIERLKRPFVWINAFACPALFLWHTGKSVSRDLIPKSFEFSVERYATLVAYSAPFHKYPEPFLCLVGMSRNYTLDEYTYPQFLRNDDEGGCSLLCFTYALPLVRICERKRDEDEPKLLEATVGRVVPLLPVAPARSSIIDLAFVCRGCTKCRGHGWGYAYFAICDVFCFYYAGAEGGDHTELLAGGNLRTIGAPKRFVIFSDSSDHSGVNIAEAEVDYVVRTFVPIIMSDATTTPTTDSAAIAKEKLVGSSVFGVDSSSAGDCHPIPGGFSDCTGSDFLIGDVFECGGMYACRLYNIREMIRLNSIVEERDALVKAKDEEIGSIKGEVASLKERNNLLVAEKSRLDVKVVDLAASVKVREQEVADLNVVVHKLEASSARLQEKVTAYENCLSQLEMFQDDRIREMNDKFDKLDTNLVEMALHLEKRFYPHLLTTISGRQWLLTHGLELTIAKCLNSTKYLSTLRAAIGKAIEKGMQDELSARITHGVEGRVLTDVAAYNPFAKADYQSALQRIQSVNFSLIAELKSNKDASIDTLMNLLRLEGSLAKKLGLTESQTHVDQLMVPIHHSPDQRVIGASVLSLLLDVSSFRVRRIKENIAHHRSTLYDVFIPLSEPLSVTALTGIEGTSNVTPATAGTTMALSVSLVSTSLIPLISTDNYEITHEEGEKIVGADANPFPDVDDTELNIPQ